MEDLKHKQFIIVDLEATCWQDKDTYTSEIIEIGAVRYRHGQILSDEFQTFIKPKLNPELSDFCKQLTTITQSQVDKAPGFIESFNAFMNWAYQDGPFMLASWGGYDLRQLKRDCKLHGIEPYQGEHLNIKQLFSDVMRVTRLGMGQALKLLKMNLEGTHHRGIDDARNITRIFNQLIEMKQ